MEKENVLEIEILKINDEWSVGYITYQNEEVLKREIFVDTKLEVYSNDNPTYYYPSDILYILGRMKSGDKTPFIIPNNCLDKLKEKVRLINEKYGISKRWRAERGGKYHYIDNCGYISESHENSSFFDNERYKEGNYFKTKELSIKCWRNYIKPAFKKFWEEEAKNERD